jgi:hypothetical protein
VKRIENALRPISLWKIRKEERCCSSYVFLIKVTSRGYVGFVKIMLITKSFPTSESLVDLSLLNLKLIITLLKLLRVR